MERKSLIILTVAVLVVMAAGALGLLLYHNAEREEMARLEPIAADEADPAVWGRHYPRNYDSYLRNMEQSATKYGGSEPFSKLERWPFLKTVYAGYSFANEFNRARGHIFSMEDQLKVHDSRKATGSACLTCKSAEVPKLMEKYGDAYYTSDYYELAAEVTHPIACLDCHDPATMDLRISRPALIEAFARRGEDITKASRQEMRTLVCAQCHVEYYFAPQTNYLIFPWDKGFKPPEVEAYYDEIGFIDWVHQEAGTPMLKAQHPEYELFLDSTHHSAGVACADCHMPYVREGNVKVVSHWWASPLKHIEDSCLVCHREDPAYLEQRVYYTQDRTYVMIETTGNNLVKAIEEIKRAAESPDVNAGVLKEARQAHRTAQWIFDWVASENSTGFHNPQAAMSLLAQANDGAHRAAALAKKARIGW